MKRKIISFILLASMVGTLLTGCGETEYVDEPIEEVYEEEDTFVSEVALVSKLPAEIGPGVTIEATPDFYDAIDLSKPYTVNMCLIGYIPEDWDKVLALANDYLKPFNTTLEVDFIPWADYQDNYLQVISSNKNYDLVFTAPWCYLYSEAAKGTFYTLDSKFAGTYMPLTYRYQKSDSWDETTLNGKTVAIPSNTMDDNGKMVAIRQDIADKLGIDELTSWDDYMNYMLRVATEVTPDTGIYALAAEGENKELWDLYKQQYNVFYIMESDFVSMIYQYDGDTPSYDEIEFTYESDIFRKYAYDMKKLYDAGAWSGTALYGSKSDDEAFAELTGASISWNRSVFQYVAQAEQNEGVECGVYFITPDNIVAAEAYSNNCMAIKADSANPERAAMVLDLLKFDTYLNHLFIMGIEGEHYEIDENGTYTETEAGSKSYPAGYISLSWAIKNGDVSEKYTDERETKILAEMDKHMVACPTVTFVFDDTKVSNEMIAVNQVLTEIVPRIQLGKVRNVDAEIDAMLGRCYASGLQLIKDEYINQYQAWLATR